MKAPTTPTIMFIKQPCRPLVPINMLATQPARAPKTIQAIKPILPSSPLVAGQALSPPRYYRRETRAACCERTGRCYTFYRFAIVSGVPMISIYPTEHIAHDPPFEFLDGALVPVYESPARLAIIHTAIARAKLGSIIPPRSFDIEHIRAVHSNDYLDYLEHIYERWVAFGGAPASVMPGTLAVRWMNRRCEHPVAAPGYYCFDMSAPIVAGTYAAARAAAETALPGAALLLEGQRVTYALCRPPGHHAGRDMCGGYCYLNNAAIAAQYLGVGGWGLGVGRGSQPPTPNPQPLHR